MGPAPGPATRILRGSQGASGRAWNLQRFERGAEGARDFEPLSRRQERADHQPPAVRGERQLAPMAGRIVHLDAQPVRLEAPSAAAAPGARARDREVARGQAQGLAHPGAAVAGPEGEPHQGDVEPEEAGDRPGAGGREDAPGGEPDRGDRRHQDREARSPEASMGLQHRGEGGGAFLRHRAIIGPRGRAVDGAGRGSCGQAVDPTCRQRSRASLFICYLNRTHHVLDVLTTQRIPCCCRLNIGVT